MALGFNDVVTSRRARLGPSASEQGEVLTQAYKKRRQLRQ